MILNLKEELNQLLPIADEVYIASALVKYSSFRFIENLLAEKCFRKYVIGIHLPTDPKVFEELLHESELRKARVFKDARTFHPKVYLLKVNQHLIAFVGSANTTNGGLEGNVEVSLKTEDQEQCQQLLTWFNELFDQSQKITSKFIDSYKRFFNRSRQRNYRHKADLNQLISKETSLAPASVGNGQFFKQNHFDAYQEIYWNDYSEPANERRKRVKDRFKELHYAIINRFDEFGLSELHAHHHTQSIVSSNIYRKNFTSKNLASMWLHYGLSKPERKGTSFLNHPRIQVILRPKEIGIWLVVGKDKGGGKAERIRFKKLMSNSKAFRELFYRDFKELGDAFWIKPSSPLKESKHVPISNINSCSALHEITKQDNLKDYFIIGRTYHPNDVSLSEDNIEDEVLTEFSRLYPLYLSLKD